MDPLSVLKAALARLRDGAPSFRKGSGVFAAAAVSAAISLGLAEAAIHAETMPGAGGAGSFLAQLGDPPAAPANRLKTRTVWIGADLDGDGQPDIANPTGRAPRGVDAYGEGCFHASRDGGAREHEGVDYAARAGQTVAAPISGYVTKIGFAYPDNATLRFVEIENPALRLSARVFYVDPDVEVGQAIAVGAPIGHAHSLQARYPGITDHVHLELAERGRKVDGQTLILAKRETVPEDTVLGD